MVSSKQQSKDARQDMSRGLAALPQRGDNSSTSDRPLSRSSFSEQVKQKIKNLLHRRGLMVGRYPLWYCLRQIHPTTVLDVGANVGVYGRHLRNLGFQGTIHSFEPYPQAFSRLREEAARSRPVNAWHCHQFGLGEEECQATMHIFNESVFNSLRERLPRSAQLHAGINGTQTTSVRIRTLDGVWPELQLSDNRVFLKIDTQGYELPILHGGDRAIEKVLAIQLEVSLSPLYKEQPCIEEVIPFLRKRGFSVFDIFPAGGIRGARNQLTEVDCLFIKESC